MRRSKVRRQFSAVLIAGVIVMAVLGVSSEGLREDRSRFTIYWAIVLLLLLWVVVLVLLELLAIRLEFTAAKQSIFHKTIGDPAFLKKLHDARQGKEKQEDEQDE
jgi:hypothetical protein